MDKQQVSPELRAKAKACTSAAELLSLAKEEGYELSEQELEGIAGGDLWGEDCGEHTEPYDPRRDCIAWGM